MEPVTTYYTDRPIVDANVAFEIIQSGLAEGVDVDTPCNYFGLEYYHKVGAEAVYTEDPTILVSFTNFPYYNGNREGDNQFLSLAGFGNFAPGNVVLCPSGSFATIYRDSFCFAGGFGDGQEVCTNKSISYMVKFPDPDTVIVGKSQNELLLELVEQTGISNFGFC